MAILPYSFGTPGNAPGSYGFGLTNTAIDEIAAQGKVQGRLQDNALANQLALADRQHAADRDVAGLQADVSRRGQDLQFQASTAPVNFARDRFNSVFPVIQAQLQANGQSGGSAPAATPPADLGPVYAPGQVDQQVNAARAGIDQQVATQQRQNAASAAGRGFGAASPLLAALNGNAAARGTAAGADAEREIRFGAAGQEAEQRATAGQQATQRYQAELDAESRRRQIAASVQANLLNALSGLA
ncbi:MAG: hypothetical protein U0871_12035 [Gemmataceae bacterium]